MSSAARRWPSPGKIALLSALYFVQGLPFGFQANALPLYLRELGVSLTGVSLTRALSAPWMLKALWAPFVDRHFWPSFGRRKSWIVPLQALLALAAVAAALVPPAEHLKWLLLAILAMNLLAATQDIAVDGLAVDLLQPHELGAGNAGQVVGYKLGMLTGGGVLVALSPFIGWRGLFFVMAGLCLLVMVVVLNHREQGADRPAEEPPRLTWPELRTRMVQIVRSPGAGWVLLFVASYKVGESLADAMFGPFLVDQHIPKETVAGWLGIWGMVASPLGSLAGGLLASRQPLLRAVGLTAAVRGAPLLAQWALVAGVLPVEPATVVGVTLAEHFFGGALTTAMFAFMMSRVDRRIGATHFTVLASVEVLGKAPAGLLSGVLADALGYGPVFALSVVLSVLFLALLVPVGRLPEVEPVPEIGA